MVAAAHDRDARPPRHHARQRNGHEVGLGARVGEADEFQCWETLDDLAREACFVDVVPRQADAVVECRAHSIEDHLLAVAVEPCGVLPQHVDVLVPVDIDDALCVAV